MPATFIITETSVKVTTFQGFPRAAQESGDTADVGAQRLISTHKALSIELQRWENI